MPRGIPKATPKAPAAEPASPAARARAAKAMRTEYPNLTDLPTVPQFRTDKTGKVITHRVPKQDADGKRYFVDEPMPFDPDGELQWRNRWGEKLMYNFKLPKKDRAPKRVIVTVNERRYTMLRGEQVIVPWFVVHHLRNNIERHYHQEDDPTQPGRKVTIGEDVEAESHNARPIDPCDDFEDDTSHLPQSGAVEDLYDEGSGQALPTDPEEALRPSIS